VVGDDVVGGASLVVMEATGDYWKPFLYRLQDCPFEVMLVNARKLWTEESDSILVLMAIEDVTERKRIHEELVRSNEDLQRFAYVAAPAMRSDAPSRTPRTTCLIRAWASPIS